MNDEFTESAKAVQEASKMATKALNVSEKIGRFLSKYLDESLEAGSGIVADKLKFMRFERQLRLQDRVDELVQERNLTTDFRPIPPKLALPILENASLEEDDELQDLWVQLFASAIDPSFNGSVRSAYIDIIKQLEVVDVHILELLYNQYVELLTKEGLELLEEKAHDGTRYLSPTKLVVTQYSITEPLGLTPEVYENSLDNLMRVRCIVSHMGNDKVKVWTDNSGFSDFTILGEYDCVAITALGISFMEACTHRKHSINIEKTSDSQP